MKAIGFKTSLPIEETNSFIQFEKEIPQPTQRQLLVKIEAVSVNPVDYKIRQNSLKEQVSDEPKIIGWDAVGVVEAVGDNVSLFNVGDRVFYAGDLNKAGSNQEFQLVDERIVGCAPRQLSTEEIAALPLTALTAYEILFDRMRLSKTKDEGKSILIIGGAGGVGSIAIQIAKQVLGLQVIATASRENSVDWCKKMGADVVVNHKNLVADMKAAGYDQVNYILDFVDVNQYWDAFVVLIKPQGQIGSISDPTGPVNLRQLKGKSVSFHWELMFTRSMFETDDMEQQHTILNTIANWVDEGIISSTLTTTLHGLSVESLKEAHRQLESGTTIGKLVIKF
ncbi:zinc-binding alcohol dehydrogenase family protein [Pedobacter sandarakinus]|uniref:zinc-binding alcohol dehydrogenase family protein n=1 Tax=Pedobacter sandarakinus TaxID=353156 RepID=UPI0022475CB9|nr:zinc-binding alcohol dehydrogenase family protein [Pedobacter sandarakinus]MCX2575858.1 zinc-binding alcohol dehydrogenase family protein [Pedobacter sandarakinus]